MAAKSSISKTILPNGVRIISENVCYVDSVSVGIWAATGSRDETPKTRGLSHFLEHMLFKGTERRSARQIADEMDSIGGHINAFTDKEFTCYYARVLAEHLPPALDILSDMVLHSVLDPDEIEREKNVVIEEIKRHRDTPEDEVHDLLAEAAWNGHTLANPVIGSASVVKKLTRESLLEYFQNHYTPDALLVAAAGRVEHNQLVDAVAQALGSIPERQSVRRLAKAKPFAGRRIVRKNTEQVHFSIGAAGYSQSEEEKYPLAVIDSVLGGGMSSRLFQEIREKRGLAYAIGSYSASYQEGGILAVYGGTSAESVQSVLELICKECTSIRRESVTEEELVRAKNQIRGTLVLGQESMSNRMSRLAKSEIYFGRIIRPDEIISQIMKVTRDEVASVATQVFDGSPFALAAIGPLTDDFEKAADKLLCMRAE